MPQHLTVHRVLLATGRAEIDPDAVCVPTLRSPGTSRAAVAGQHSAPGHAATCGSRAARYNACAPPPSSATRGQCTEEPMRAERSRWDVPRADRFPGTRGRTERVAAPARRPRRVEFTSTSRAPRARRPRSATPPRTDSGTAELEDHIVRLHRTVAGPGCSKRPGRCSRSAEPPGGGCLPVRPEGSIRPASAIFAMSQGGGCWIVTALGGVSPYGVSPDDGDMSGPASPRAPRGCLRLHSQSPTPRRGGDGGTTS